MHLLLKLAASAAMAASLGAAPAAAQYFLPPPPPPLAPSEAAAILREELGLRRVGYPAFTGRFYIVEAVDFDGARVRVVMNARSGRILEVEELAPAPLPRAMPRERSAALPPAAAPASPSPLPPRRPAPREDQVRPLPSPPAQAARPPAKPTPERREIAPPAAPAQAAPPPIVNMERRPTTTDPSAVRLPDEADRRPPLAAPSAGPDAPVARDGSPVRDVTRQPLPGAPTQPNAGPPEAGLVDPAPLDETHRSAPATPPVEPAPLY